MLATNFVANVDLHRAAKEVTNVFVSHGANPYLWGANQAEWTELDKIESGPLMYLLCKPDANTYCTYLPIAELEFSQAAGW